MTLPEHIVIKRRLQIPDHSTRRPQRFDTPEHEYASLHENPHEDSWVANFITRLAGLVRNIGGPK
jgi:hypothetical protein